MKYVKLKLLHVFNSFMLFMVKEWTFYETINFDGFVKSPKLRHSGEPRIESGAGAGVQNVLKALDSGVRRNDVKKAFSTFYESINFER